MSRMIFAVLMVAAAMAATLDKQTVVKNVSKITGGEDSKKSTPAPTAYTYKRTNTYYSDRDCKVPMDWTKTSDSVCQDVKKDGCEEVKIITAQTIEDCKSDAENNDSCDFSSSETTNGVKVTMYSKSISECERDVKSIESRAKDIISGNKSEAEDAKSKAKDVVNGNESEVKDAKSKAKDVVNGNKSEAEDVKSKAKDVIDGNKSEVKDAKSEVKDIKSAEGAKSKTKDVINGNEAKDAKSKAKDVINGNEAEDAKSKAKDVINGNEAKDAKSKARDIINGKKSGAEVQKFHAVQFTTDIKNIVVQELVFVKEHLATELGVAKDKVIELSRNKKTSRRRILAEMAEGHDVSKASNWEIRYQANTADENTAKAVTSKVSAKDFHTKLATDLNYDQRISTTPEIATMRDIKTEIVTVTPAPKVVTDKVNNSSVAAAYSFFGAIMAIFVAIF